MIGTYKENRHKNDKLMFSIVQCPRNIPKLVDLYYIHAPLSYQKIIIPGPTKYSEERMTPAEYLQEQEHIRTPSLTQPLHAIANVKSR